MRLWAYCIVAFIGATASAETQCPTLFADQAPPAQTTPSDPITIVELCYTHFAVLHSSTTLTPIYSAERLTAADVAGSDSIGRKDAFHAEKRLKRGKRAELADYRGFKDVWDRGHMAPANDAPDMDSQYDTFTLANMVPQASNLNQKQWRFLEASMHALAKQDGDLFMVTGPIYTIANSIKLHDRVAVPDYTFKAVYDPGTRRAIAYVATNRNDGVCWVISLVQLKQMAGLDPFPTLTDDQKRDATPWDLPKGDGTSPPDCVPVPSN